VTFLDKQISGKPPHVINRTGLCRTFQNINLFPEMTALENVVTAYCVHTDYNMLSAIFGGKLFKSQEKAAKETALHHLEFVGLKDDINVKAKNLPYGKRRLLEIARVLATNPKLLLLDEPVAGMNEQESNSVAEIVNKMRSIGGKTILLVEHYMRFVMTLCDELTVLNSGMVIAEGVPKDIQNNAEVIACYLGKRNRGGTKVA
jgi:ABC-type branched-subunit amino acid transport system ATPase component